MTIENTVTHVYARHGEKRNEEFECVKDALRSAYWGEETGNISSIAVYDSSGETVFDKRMGNIFDFCEEREYDWTVEY